VSRTAPFVLILFTPAVTRGLVLPLGVDSPYVPCCPVGCVPLRLLCVTVSCCESFPPGFPVSMWTPYLRTSPFYAAPVLLAINSFSRRFVLVPVQRHATLQDVMSVALERLERSVMHMVMGARGLHTVRHATPCMPLAPVPCAQVLLQFSSSPYSLASLCRQMRLLLFPVQRYCGCAYDRLLCLPAILCMVSVHHQIWGEAALRVDYQATKDNPVVGRAGLFHVPSDEFPHAAAGDAGGGSGAGTGAGGVVGVAPTDPGSEPVAAPPGTCHGTQFVQTPIPNSDLPHPRVSA
jgi:hypothetical protein